MSQCSCRGSFRRRHRKPVRRPFPNRRLTLQKPVKSDDGAGGETITWQDQAVIYAVLFPLCASETLLADMESGTVLWEAHLRWRNDVHAGDRFVRDDGGVLQVQAVFDPDGRRRLLICRCLERPQ